MRINAKYPQSLSIAEKIGQLFFIGLPGPELDDVTFELIKTVKPGGVCLFARNIKSASQTRELLDGIRSASTIEPFLSIDQEGGAVDRLRRIIEPMPAASQIRTGDQAAKLGRIIGETLRRLGFNTDFAPVVDVINEERSSYVNGLRSRNFGDSVRSVTEMSGAFLRELRSAGILGCLKHFPGLGASQLDSHEDLPVIEIERSELDDIDLAPYRELLPKFHEVFVMVAHAAYPKAAFQSSDQAGRVLPSSLDPKVINVLLRNELGFNGVVLTDDLEMGAIIKNYGIDEAARMAISAGNDMLAICAGQDNIRRAHESIAEMLNNEIISEKSIDLSIGRILDLKSHIMQPLPFDVSRIEALSQEIVELKNAL
ncbi:glycoside hydrolase family 3 protein [Leptolyngbya sp. 7M]|uniref:glycoside hydrolase family 3 protein n=1 Tax=Leptolyngbya sp. 7M TaxID=2812896 RepID=UPI001B8CD1F1|nr:glycoside hydrolase family 3 protein [Leptolyngbya sp. 7M]QYO66516.1 hypothetical protein JVX88_06870 [Leptolyngbya sp. 7M]